MMAIHYLYHNGTSVNNHVHGLKILQLLPWTKTILIEQVTHQLNHSLQKRKFEFHGVIYASPIYKGNTIHGFEQGYGKQSSLRTCANLFIYVYKDIV